MRSVADTLRADTRRDLARLSGAERIQIALDLGEADLDLLCAARGMARDEARRFVSRTRKVGRFPSSCLQAEGP